MTQQERLDRVNELARKAKVQELTEEEKIEQDKLRREYAKIFGQNFRKRLSNMTIEYKD